MTVRFAQLHTFPRAIIERVERRPRSAPDVFMVILEAMIDYSADRLEELRAEALKISNRIFHKERMEDLQFQRAMSPASTACCATRWWKSATWASA